MILDLCKEERNTESISLFVRYRPNGLLTIPILDSDHSPSRIERIVYPVEFDRLHSPAFSSEQFSKESPLSVSAPIGVHSESAGHLSIFESQEVGRSVKIGRLHRIAQV